MSGADLQNVLNEAAILSVRKNKTEITTDVIFEAIEKIQIGLKKESKQLSESTKVILAYHEAGHALLATVMDSFDKVKRVTIQPRGETNGITLLTPEEEQVEMGMFSKKYLEDKICVSLGGRIAEEILNGKDQVTTGAQNDLVSCTKTAKLIV